MSVRWAQREWWEGCMLEGAGTYVVMGGMWRCIIDSYLFDHLPSIAEMNYIDLNKTVCGQ